MDSFISLKEKDGIAFKYVMPFNPTLNGWKYESACCCNVVFSKDNKSLVVASKKKRIEVRDGDNIINAFPMPINHKEFEKINKWL
jgi:hypothetical protein